MLNKENAEEKTAALTSPITTWSDGDAQNITFILTENCQLRCRYCYICGKNSYTVMDFEEARRAVDYILTSPEIFSQKAVIWDFIGGEPFLEVELMDRICDYIKTRMYELNHPWFDVYRFSLATNGLLYDDPAVQRFIEKNRSHLSVGISLDGVKEKHDLQRVFPDGSGSYDAVVSKVPLWISQFKDATTKATVGRDDLKYVKDSVLHLWELGISNVAMNCIFEDVWQDGDDDILEKQLTELADVILEKRLYEKNKCSFFDRNIGFYLDPKRENGNWCGAGRMAAVDARGEIFPCVRFADYSLGNRPGVAVGNVRDGYDFNRLRPFLALDRSTQSPQECLDCEVASGCAWCQGNNYDCADTDTIYQRATYICKMHKARVRANNYLWNKLDKIAPPTDEYDPRVRGLRERKGLRYLFVQLDSDAPSVCYYDAPKTTANVAEPTRRMSLETLKKLVYYGLTENLAFHFLTNGTPLSDEFVDALKYSDYLVYRPYSVCGNDEKSVDVFDFESDVWNDDKPTGRTLVVRVESANLPKLTDWLQKNGAKIGRVSLFIKDVEKMAQTELDAYKKTLAEIVDWLPAFVEENRLELSFLTDRLILNEPNHCDAGVKNLTVALDGRFYLCPGFLADDAEKNALADLDSVLKTHEIPIKNRQLLRLDHSPICKDCDAYHCRRCVWLNKKTTREVNTPSRQQCVMAHLERNASRDLIEPLYIGDMVQIPEIDYLDPFDELMKQRRPQPQTEANKGKTNEC